MYNIYMATRGVMCIPWNINYNLKAVNVSIVI